MKIFLILFIAIILWALLMKFIYEYSKNMQRIKKLDELMDKVERSEMVWEEFDKINDLDIKQKE